MANATNIGDVAAVGFPRFYMDAEIAVTAEPFGTIAKAPSSSEQHLRALRQPLVIVPRPHLVTDGRTSFVLWLFAINSRLPFPWYSLFGRGPGGLAEGGCRRFDAFPGMLVDVRLLASLCSTADKVEVIAIEPRVKTPLAAGDLARRLARVPRGNAEMRATGAADSHGKRDRRVDRFALLREVVVTHPWLAPAGVAHTGITIIAAVTARRHATGPAAWVHDQSALRFRRWECPRR